MIKKYLQAVTVFTFLLALLFFPHQCIEASRRSLLLWFEVIIPTLFPFIFITYLMTNSIIIKGLNQLISPLFRQLFNLSGSASIAILMGFLGGYPMGALVTNNLYENQLISQSEAKYLLSFTNNASPMFIIGFIGTLIHSTKGAYLILINVYLSALIVGFFYNLLLRPKPIKNYKQYSKSLHPINFKYLDQCIVESALILLKVGGYMLLCSIPVYILEIILPKTTAVYFSLSFVELGLGENIIASLTSSTTQQYAMLSALTAFGSLSVIGQTASVLTKKDLHMKDYIIPKLIQGLLAYINIYLFSQLSHL